jgi:methylated-DNA-[protein]-cysteine S-methyltransferase
VTVVETRYGVPGWGVGVVWERAGTLLAHEFEFGADVRERVASDTVSQGMRALVGRFRAFLGGREDDFADIQIDLDWATPLQRAIAETLRAVPRGEVVSYGELSALAGRPGAPRAAGAFCAANRFAFVVPCHRVVAANGIGGYGDAGIEVKRRLLALEGVVL